LTRWITSFRRVGKLWRRTDDVHRLRLHRGGDLAEVLRRVGFHVRVVRSYGRLPLPAHCVGIIARKV
ncbi:MAG: class I SAM-dependent methyltransferase, partial [Tepidisphaeraceae bacterium]